MTTPTSQRPKLRVGILLESTTLPAWFYKMLERIQSSSYAEITLLVLDNTPSKPSNLATRWSSEKSLLLFRLYSRLEKKIVHPKPDAFEQVDASDMLGAIPTANVTPRRSKYSSWIEGEDLKQVKEHEVDLFILAGFGILRGEILRTAKYGVWSYHHGDNRKYRGMPAGFWEVFLQDPVTGSIVQQLSEELDGGLVLNRSFSATNYLSVRRNKNNLFWKSLSMLPRALEQLHRKGPDQYFQEIREQNAAPDVYSHRLYKAPRNVEFAKLACRHVGMYIKKKLYKMLYREQWTLLFQDNDTFPLNPWRMKKLQPPRERFWADPFLIYKDNKHYIFFEDCLEHPEFGHISVIERDAEGNFSEPQSVLKKPYHLSYPCVFEWENTYYMIPETMENKTIELYRCDEFPLKWSFVKNIFEDVQAVDATPFHHDGRWWLFANNLENEGASIWDEVFLYYADSPLSDSWTPHPENPIVSDVRRARPAGKIFSHMGSLYRPAQNCAQAYGHGIQFNRITKLTPTEYHEEPESNLTPDWSPEAKGTHTYNAVHGLTVIDAKFRKFRWR